MSTIEYLDEAMRRRFVKDFNLPISVIKDPYFEYYVNLYNNLLDSKRKLKTLTNAIERFGGSQKLMSYTTKVINDIVNTVSDTKAFQKFSNTPNTELRNQYPKLTDTPDQKVYQESNINHVFVSMDLKSANFNALRLHDPEIVFNASNYNEFIKKFTDCDYVSKSKMIRQVIFGKLDPKKQVLMQRHHISRIIVALISSGFSKNSFVTASSDEVILKSSWDKIQSDVKKIANVLQNDVSDLSSCTRVEAFHLNVVKDRNQRNYYVKEYIDVNDANLSQIHKFELKAVPSHIYAQAYKKYLSKPIDKYDLKFVHDGYLCSFDEPVFEQ